MAAPVAWPSHALREAYHALPHIELHRHLVGGMRPSRVAALAQRADPATHLREASDVAQWLAANNLDDFVTRYLELIALFTRVDDLADVAQDLAHDLHAQGVQYAEITFLPARLVRANGFPFDEIADALRQGLDRGGAGPSLRVRFLMDMVRELPIEVGLSMLEAGKAYLPDLIVGIDLGGREHRVAPNTFAKVFETARGLGYRTVAHAGETVGPVSIRAAVEILGVDRVQHGVRCLEDDDLIGLLRERQTPLAVCPTSNVRLGVFPRHEDVPLRRLLDEGLCVSLHTDDPLFFDVTLEHEHAVMSRAAKLTVDDLTLLHDNAQRGRLDRQ